MATGMGTTCSPTGSQALSPSPQIQPPRRVGRPESIRPSVRPRRPRHPLRDDHPDKHLRHAIAAAHCLSIKVMLKSHISLAERGDGIWRGSIAMETKRTGRGGSTTTSASSSTTRTRPPAAEVELFCVGVELAASLTREADWRRVIERAGALPGPAGVTRPTGGRITAGSPSGRPRLHRRQRLLPPQPNSGSTLQQLRWSTRAVVYDLSQLHQATGKPIIFTKIGYKSVRARGLKPWE